MSGGALDYVCYKVDDAATTLIGHHDPTIAAFGRHLLLVGKALHEVEWAISGDSSYEKAEQAILEVFDQSKEEITLPILIDRAESARLALDISIGMATAKLGNKDGRQSP